MIKKVTKIIVDIDGSIIDTVRPLLVAHSGYANVIQVIAPFPTDNYVGVDYTVRASVKRNEGQFLSATVKKGRDVLSKELPYFNDVEDWNVWEGVFSSKALAFISKYRAGQLLTSLSIFEKQVPPLATNFIGGFKEEEELIGNDGDYYKFEGIKLVLSNDEETVLHLGDYVYMYNGEWRKGHYTSRVKTSSIELPVDPSIESDIEINLNEDIELLYGVISSLVGLEEYAMGLAIQINDAVIDINSLDENKLDKVETQTPGLENYDRIYIVDRYGNQLMAIGSVQSLDDAYVKRDATGHIPVLVAHNIDANAHKTLFNAKLDKVWSGVTSVNQTFLSDEVVINRVGELFKTTIADILTYSGVTELVNVVDVLPETGEPNKIYLVPKGGDDPIDLYDEYVWLVAEERFEFTGSKEISLTDYFTKNEARNEFLSKAFFNALVKEPVLENEITITLQASSRIIVPFNLTEDKLRTLTLYIDDNLMLDAGDPQFNYDWYDSEEGYFVLENQPLGFEWQFNYVDNKVVDIGAMGGELKFVVNIRDYVDASIFGAMEGDY